MNFRGTLTDIHGAQWVNPEHFVDPLNFCPGRQNSKGTTHSYMKTPLLSTHPAQILAFCFLCRYWKNEHASASFRLFFLKPNSNGVFAEENFDAKLVYTHTDTHRRKGEAHSENI